MQTANMNDELVTPYNQLRPVPRNSEGGISKVKFTPEKLFDLLHFFFQRIGDLIGKEWLLQKLL